MARSIVPYLFDPSVVAEALAERPHLALLVGDPDAEGAQSDAFGALRRSDRQLFRLLARPEALAPLLDVIESSLEAGFSPGVGLRSRNYEDFGSALAEVFVAGDFIRRGFAITELAAPLETDPDIVVTAGSVEAIVEVVRPRQWSHSRIFRRALADLVEHVDVPQHFLAEIREDLVDEFIDDRLQYQHPADSDVAHELMLRQLPELQKGLEQLIDGFEPTTFTLIAGNHRTSITITAVDPLPDMVPTRGCTTHSSATGWRPEALIDRLVERVRRKAKRRQAGTLDTGALRILIADIESSEVSTEVGHEHYNSVFLQSMNDGLTPSVGSGRAYDAIVLARPNVEALNPLYVIEDDDRRQDVRQILGE